MRLNMYCVFDEKAEAYLPPFFVQTEGQALRAFTDAVNDPQHNFGKHPHDYTMWFVGTFSDAKAEFSIADRRLVAAGVEVKRSERTYTQVDIDDALNKTGEFENA